MLTNKQCKWIRKECGFNDDLRVKLRGYYLRNRIEYFIYDHQTELGLSLKQPELLSEEWERFQVVMDYLVSEVTRC